MRPACRHRGSPPKHFFCGKSDNRAGGGSSPRGRPKRDRHHRRPSSSAGRAPGATGTVAAVGSAGRIAERHWRRGEPQARRQSSSCLYVRGRSGSESTNRNATRPIAFNWLPGRPGHRRLPAPRLIESGARVIRRPPEHEKRRDCHAHKVNRPGRRWSARAPSVKGTIARAVRDPSHFGPPLLMLTMMAGLLAAAASVLSLQSSLGAAHRCHFIRWRGAPPSNGAGYRPLVDPPPSSAQKTVSGPCVQASTSGDDGASR